MTKYHQESIARKKASIEYWKKQPLSHLSRHDEREQRGQRHTHLENPPVTTNVLQKLLAKDRSGNRKPANKIRA